MVVVSLPALVSDGTGTVDGELGAYRWKWHPLGLSSSRLPLTPAAVLEASLMLDLVDVHTLLAYT